MKKYGGDIDRYISDIAEEERPGYEGADYPDDEEGYIKTAKEAGFPFKSPLKNIGGSVLDSLRNVKAEENEMKYKIEADEINTKIDSLYNDLNEVRLPSFKTQAEYDAAHEKVKSEAKQLRQDFRKRTSFQNIDNQVMDDYIKVYDTDVKKYKKGELTFKEMKERYPNIHETDLK